MLWVHPVKGHWNRLKRKLVISTIKYKGGRDNNALSIGIVHKDVPVEVRLPPEVLSAFSTGVHNQAGTRHNNTNRPSSESTGGRDSRVQGGEKLRGDFGVRWKCSRMIQRRV